MGRIYVAANAPSAWFPAVTGPRPLTRSDSSSGLDELEPPEEAAQTSSEDDFLPAYALVVAGHMTNELLPGEHYANFNRFAEISTTDPDPNHLISLPAMFSVTRNLTQDRFTALIAPRVTDQQVEVSSFRRYARHAAGMAGVVPLVNDVSLAALRVPPDFRPDTPESQLGYRGGFQLFISERPEPL